MIDRILARVPQLSPGQGFAVCGAVAVVIWVAFFMWVM